MSCDEIRFPPILEIFDTKGFACYHNVMLQD